MVARLTALGLERDGKRVVTVAGHRDGVSLKTLGTEFVAMSPDEAEHVITLLSEQLTNFRLNAQTQDAA